jgi:hypothetical protein
VPARTKAAVLGLGLGLLCLSMAGDAIAAGEPAFGCGHVHTAQAQRNPFGAGNGPPPIAIGDSTMLLPIPDLTRVGFDVNAKGCRGFKQSIWVARDMRNRGVLPRLVLVNAYGNGGVNDDLIRFALKVLGPKRTLVLVTAYDADTGHPPAPDTDVLVNAARRYPDRIRLLDWVRYSLPHHKVEPAPGAWFLPDLFHPNFTGAHAYANFLARVLPGGPPESAEESSGGGTTWWLFPLVAGILTGLVAILLYGRRSRRAGRRP